MSTGGAGIALSFMARNVSSRIGTAITLTAPLGVLRHAAARMLEMPQGDVRQQGVALTGRGLFCGLDHDAISAGGATSSAVWAGRLSRAIEPSER
jgi:hypothetical protein